MAETEFFTFVVYHTAVSKKGIETIGNIYEHGHEVKWKERWETFEKDFLPHASRYIQLLFDSIKLVHSKCRYVVLTDQTTQFDLPEDIKIIRYTLDSDKPAYMRLLAQIKFLEESNSTSHVLFLDYDMLLQHPLSDLCKHDFDVALTCQSQTRRIEGSFIMVRNHAINKGVAFLKAIEKYFQTHYPSYDAWGGIEASMNDLVHVQLPLSNSGAICKIEDVTVRVFSGEKYNYIFVLRDLVMGIEYHPDKVLLHFRGEIKSLMLDYWNNYLRLR